MKVHYCDINEVHLQGEKLKTIFCSIILIFKENNLQLFTKMHDQTRNEWVSEEFHSNISVAVQTRSAVIKWPKIASDMHRTN
jgi:hypothetical protein